MAAICGWRALCVSARPFTRRRLIRYYRKRVAVDEMIAVFQEMQKRGLFPDPCVYPSLIKAFGRNGILFHSQLIKLGIDGGKYIRNVLIHAYGKYGPIESARQMFDEMTDRSTADWNALIQGHWNYGREEEAKKLFELMPSKNVISWTTMVTGCSNLKDLGSARSYFDKMPEKSVVSWNAMISGYAQNGFSEEAIRLFHEMMKLGLRPDETTLVAVISSCSSDDDVKLVDSALELIDEGRIHLNMFVKTALLDFYAKSGRLGMAQRIFDEMRLSRNPVTWNSMILAYLRAGKLNSAKELFNEMPNKDVVSWNTMIGGYSQHGQSVHAIELFHEMIEKQVTPDEVTMINALSACGHLGALEHGNSIVELIAKSKIRLTQSGYNSLIFMYSRCGNIDKAKMTFSEMKARDVVAYNVLMNAFASHGATAQALELLQRMKDEGIEPDRITYIAALTACSHSGFIEQGRKIFESIKAPDVDHYACMIDLLGRVGELDEAKRMVQELPMDPHAGVYGSLLSASRIHKRLDLGELAATKLFELEPDNTGNYILLSNMYASAGKWKGVNKIRELMKARGLTKARAFSWVEHEGKIHKFMAGDRSHERTAEIYDKLKEIRKKMRAAGYIPDKSNALRDVEDEEKEEMVGTHSEKLAIAFCLVVSDGGSAIRVMKNLRICWDCHHAVKMISKLENREIVVRDNNRFHYFRDNSCSCNDYW